MKDKREVDFDYSDTVLSFSRLDDDGSVPVYCAEFSSAPQVKEIITENRDHLALNPSRAFKIRRSAPDAAPEKLSRIDYVDGKRYADSLAVCCLGTTFSWLSSDEVMLFDAEITQGGIYEAELVHAANIPSDWKIEFSLSVNGQSAKVGEEKRRFAISKTGSANSMVVREIGRFELAKGIHRFTLEKLCDDYDLPIVEIRLVRVK